MTLRRGPVRIGVLVCLAVAALLLARRDRSAPGFAAATDCLDAFCEAGSRGDVAAYLGCLEPPLRDRLSARFPTADELADHLRREARDLKSWVQLPESDDGREAFVAVEEVRSAGTRRVRYRLVRAGSGWRIAEIEAPRAVPAVVPYGTPVSGT